MIFVGVKILPIYVNNYQMQDAIESEARFAIGNRLGAKDIRDNIWKKVNEIGVPADQESLKVTANQGSIQISLDYSVPVDLLVYKFTLDFHDHADNRSIWNRNPYSMGAGDALAAARWPETSFSFEQ